MGFDLRGETVRRVSKIYERMNNRSSYEGRTADALALGADERRDKLR